jgi:hypothetical protein
MWEAVSVGGEIRIDASAEVLLQEKTRGEKMWVEDEGGVVGAEGEL